MAITIKNLKLDFMGNSTSIQTLYTAPITPTDPVSKAAVVSSIILFPTSGGTGTITIYVTSGATSAVIHTSPNSTGNRVVFSGQITLAPGESISAQVSTAPPISTLGYVISGIERDV